MTWKMFAHPVDKYENGIFYAISTKHFVLSIFTVESVLLILLMSELIYLYSV